MFEIIEKEDHGTIIKVIDFGRVGYITRPNGIRVRITDRMKPMAYDLTLPWLASWLSWSWECALAITESPSGKQR